MVLMKDPIPGEIEKYVDAVMEAMPYGVKAMNGAAYGIKHVTKAEAAYYTCDMKEAESCAYKAIYQAEQNAQLDTVCAAYFVLLRVYVNAGNYAKADHCIKRLQEKIEAPPNVAFIKNCLYTRDVMEGWYYTRLGVAEEVPDWILKKEKRDQVSSPNNSGRDRFVYAYWLLAKENYLELSALLGALEDYYNAKPLLLAKLEVQIYKSIVAHKTDDIAGSMAALQNAYDLAIDNALFMPFIELGKYMHAVIYAVKRNDWNGIPDAWLEEMYRKTATYERHLSNVNARYRQTLGSNTSPLTQFTERDTQIIEYLCQGLTIGQIANSLYISPSAVKKALTAIYGKLGATNRADAVRIAMQLGIHK